MNDDPSNPTLPKEPYTMRVFLRNLGEAFAQWLDLPLKRPMHLLGLAYVSEQTGRTMFYYFDRDDLLVYIASHACDRQRVYSRAMTADLHEMYCTSVVDGARFQ